MIVRTIQKDYSISLVRLLATIFIVTCHFMQYYNFVLAWWFNVGVQIFLCMSGFLYAKKKIEEPIRFYKKQLLKILIEYYIVVVTVIVIQLIIVPQEITTTKIIYALLTYGTLSGGEHLWYIPYILLCYMLTPLIALLMQSFYADKKNTRFIVGSVLTLCSVFILFSTFFTRFNSAWINCYIIGYILGFCEKENRGLFKKLFLLISAVCILMNAIQIYCDYVLKIAPTGRLKFAYTLYCNYAHVALGCFIFLSIHISFSKFFKNKKSILAEKVFGVSDTLSYNVYLIHQFFILGPLSLMNLTKFQWLNCVLIIFLISILAVLLRYAALFVRNLFLVIKEKTIKHQQKE